MGSRVGVVVAILGIALGGCAGGIPFPSIRDAAHVVAAADQGEIPAAVSAMLDAYCGRCNGRDLPIDNVVCGKR